MHLLPANTREEKATVRYRQATVETLKACLVPTVRDGDTSVFTKQLIYLQRQNFSNQRPWGLRGEFSRCSHLYQTHCKVMNFVDPHRVKTASNAMDQCCSDTAFRSYGAAPGYHTEFSYNLSLFIPTSRKDSGLDQVLSTSHSQETGSWWVTIPPRKYSRVGFGLWVIWEGAEDGRKETLCIVFSYPPSIKISFQLQDGVKFVRAAFRDSWHSLPYARERYMPVVQIPEA